MMQFNGDAGLARADGRYMDAWEWLQELDGIPTWRPDAEGADVERGEKDGEVNGK